MGTYLNLCARVHFFVFFIIQLLPRTNKYMYTYIIYVYLIILTYYNARAVRGNNSPRDRPTIVRRAHYNIIIKKEHTRVLC